MSYPLHPPLSQCLLTQRVPPRLMELKAPECQYHFLRIPMRTARMVVRVSPAMSSGLSASIAESTNPNTTTKIVVERNTDPSLPTMVLKRIYGSFPGQVLVVVVLDANDRIYILAYALVEAENKN
ncbi:hypothetical protein Tco_1196531 [Tanacetum coccineum]